MIAPTPGAPQRAARRLRYAIPGLLFILALGLLAGAYPAPAARPAPDAAPGGPQAGITTAPVILHSMTNPATVLYSQYNVPSQYGVTSQQFEPARSAYSAQAADDFFVPNGETWTVDQVEVAGIYSGPGVADSVNVFFYDILGTLPGTPIYTATNLLYTPGPNPGDFVIHLSPPAVLAPGTHWLSVQANEQYNAAGQWFWRDRQFTNTYAAAWRNPGGGFSTGCLNWGSRAYACFISPWTGADEVFQLSGASNVTPSPTRTGTPPTATRTATPAAPPPTATGVLPPPDLTHSVPPIPSPTPDTCGPNSNYTYIARSNATVVPGTTLVPGSQCDDCIAPLALPFPYVLYGQAFNSVGISDNGSLQFLSNWTGYNNYCLPTGFLNTSIVPHWADTRTNIPTCPGGCGVYISISGNAPNRVLNVEWRATYYSSGQYLNYEVRLYENVPRFEIIYGTGVGQSSYTVGVQRDSGSLFTRYSCNTGGVSPGIILTFDQLVCGTPTPTVTGTPPTATQTRTPTLTSTPTNTLSPSATASNTPIPVPTYYTCGPMVDVPPNHPDYPSIRCVTCNGVMSVYDCGSPGEPCNANNDPYFRPAFAWDGTRGETAKLLSRAANFQDPIPSTQQTFEDVPPNNPYWLYVERMTGRGLMSGYTCGGPGEPCIPPQFRPYFRPSGSLVRGQFAKTLANTANFTETVPPNQQTFEDVPSTNPFWVFIERLANRNIMDGYACGGPGEPCIPPGNRPYFRVFNDMSTNTRAEVARTLARTFFPGCGLGTPTPTASATASATATRTVTPTASATRTVTLTPPASPTRTVTPTATACTLTFSDVDPGNPFYVYIRCLACRQIVSGYADGTYRWGNQVTRGQLSKIIANAAGLSAPIASTQQTFQDVPNSNAFWLFVERLAGTGAISGYTCGGAGEPCVPPQNRAYFRWGNNATRGQISKITAIAAAIPDPIPTTRQTFEDVPGNNPFWLWIEQLAGRGVISGYTCGGAGEPCMPPGNRPYFRWGADATRGQMAKIAANTFFPNCQTPARR